MLLLAQHNLSTHYKLNATAMAILDALLADVLSILFTYLPIRKLRKYLSEPSLVMQEIERN